MTNTPEKAQQWGLTYAHKADAFASTPWWLKEAGIAVEATRDLPPESVVVDYGCNTGRFISLCKKVSSNLKYVGIDPNIEGLKILLERHPDVVVTHDAKYQSDSSADLVACIHAINQMDDAEHELSEMWRILKPGGKIVVITHNPWYSRYVKGPTNLFNAYKGDPTIKREPTRGELQQMLWDAGFMPDQCYWFGGGLIKCLQPRIAFLGHKPPL